MIFDLKYALRMLRRTPAFSLLVLSLLTLGIGTNTAMFSIIDAWLLQPLHFPQPDHLAIVLKSEVKTPTQPKIFDSYRDWDEWQRQNRSFVNLAAIFWRSFEATEKSDGVFGMIVSENLFDTLGVAPERGRTFRPEDVSGPPVAVITYAFWKSRFGAAADVVGRQIALGPKTYQIIGVMPQQFDLRMIEQDTDTQLFALMQRDEKPYSSGGIGPVAAIGRLKPEVTIDAAQADLAAIQHKLDEQHPDNPKGYTVLVSSLQLDNTRSVRSSLWLSAGALGFVLLIVCANVGSLLVGRNLQRQRELSVRWALGSGRARIVRQLWTESAVIASLGAIGGVVLAYVAIEVIRAINPFGRTPANPITIDARALLFTLLATVLTTVIFGLLPAFQAAGTGLHQAMKTAARNIAGSQGAMRSRGLLVAGQIALSLVLVVGAALLMETLSRLQSYPLGLRVSGITVVNISIPKDRWSNVPVRHQLYDRLINEMKSRSGVEGVAISNASPIGGGFEDRLSIEGQPEATPERAPKAARKSVSTDYFTTLNIPLISGRLFDDHDTDKSGKVVIVSQNFARRWFANGDALGHRLKLAGENDWRTIVGVVGDTSYTFYNTLEWLTGPQTFTPSQQVSDENVSPVAREVWTIIRGSGITADGIKTTLKWVDPALHLGRMKTLQDMVDEALRQPRLRSRLLGLFAILSLLLAAIGIYGVMAQSVIQRTNEIGVRMALGARASNMIGMVASQGLRLATAGVVIGVFAALAVTRILARFLYGVKPADIWAYLIAAVVLLAAVVLAAILPARAATRVDPMIALRQE